MEPSVTAVRFHLSDDESDVSFSDDSTPTNAHIRSLNTTDTEERNLHIPTGWLRERVHHSLPESYASIPVAPSNSPWWKQLASFSGIGMMVSVGYMDPGNWSTDIAGGASFGYTLIFVIFLSNVMAILLQHLSLKLGIASGRDLAQACRDAYPLWVCYTLWIMMETAIAATDLAEVIGSAIAINLLSGIPLVAGVAITVADVMVILLLQQKNFRYLEIMIIMLTTTISVCFVYELSIAGPDWAGVFGGLLPRPEIVSNSKMLYIAIGIMGATVMPHNLFLHSSVVQTRAYPRTLKGKKMAVYYATLDSTMSLMVAFLVNSSILILAVVAFHNTGQTEVADISEAYMLLNPALGSRAASALFAVALLSSGQQSTITGTLSGQIVMEGFVNITIKPWVRRLLTRGIAVVPAAIVAGVYGDSGANTLLILSQVILSMLLSFAVIPLVLLTSSAAKMSPEFQNSKIIIVLASIVATIIAGFNAYLVITTIREAVADE